jgi:hypothetical protein
MTKPQNQNIRIAILKHKLRNGKLITKQTKSIHPDKILAKKLFEQNPFVYKSKNQ